MGRPGPRFFPLSRAVNLKRIWPRRELFMRPGEQVFCFLFFVVGSLDEATASAASMQFTALLSVH